MMAGTEPVIMQQRLALGLQLRDAVRRRDLTAPVRVELETGLPHLSPFGRSRARYSHPQRLGQRPTGLVRHFSGRYSLHYFPDVAAHVDLRIYDLFRRHVPRRLRIPIVSLADVLLREANEVPDYLAGRARFPQLYPGASYPVHGRVTGFRGRVLLAGEPLRWAVIEARASTNGDTVLARARGDDRGEFLLLIPPQATPASDLDVNFELAISVWGRPADPVPPTAETPRLDPYWDAPLEVVTEPVATDDVSAGTAIPAGYVQADPVTIQLQVTRLLSSRALGDLNFSVP